MSERRSERAERVEKKSAHALLQVRQVALTAHAQGLLAAGAWLHITIEDEGKREDQS